MNIVCHLDSPLGVLLLTSDGTCLTGLYMGGPGKSTFGGTLSYGQLAKRLGNPNACRAVGLANGRNPIAVIVPCHRVIGADGSLTGFGGGLPRKQWLLAHEGLPVNGALKLTAA